MNHREKITQDLQAAIDETSAAGICELYQSYNVREPLIDAIKRGDGFLWRSEKARELIASVMAGAKQQKGRPKNLDIEHRNLKLMCELHYLRGRGVTMYATSNSKKLTACEQIAQRYHLEEQTIRELWKANRESENALYRVAFKAGETLKGG